MASIAVNLDTDTRTATVEHNPWWARRGMGWEVRCFGRGVCTAGEGVPCYYGDEVRARQVATTWIATGVAPADQRGDR